MARVLTRATPKQQMFRLLRTFILVMVAFVAGMMYERQGQQDICENGGGLWVANICLAAEMIND